MPLEQRLSISRDYDIESIVYKEHFIEIKLRRVTKQEVAE